MDNDQQQPVTNAIAVRVSPRSGVAPPVQYRWKKGCPSPNPKGLQPAGGRIRSWYNAMSTWPTNRIKSVLKDAKAPAAKKAAARTWLFATSTRCNVAGNPLGGAEVDRITDYTEGRPVQRTEVANVGNVFDPSRLTDAELATMRALALKMRVGTPQPVGERTVVHEVESEA